MEQSEESELRFSIKRKGRKQDEEKNDQKTYCVVVLSGSMIFGNAGITMASETEPETVQEM